MDHGKSASLTISSGTSGLESEVIWIVSSAHLSSHRSVRASRNVATVMCLYNKYPDLIRHSRAEQKFSRAISSIHVLRLKP